MRNWMKQNKKKSALFFAGILLVTAGAIAVAFMDASRKEKYVYKETGAVFGPANVEVTEDGTVEVGTVQQKFELDISEYSGSSVEFSFQGPMMNMRMQNNGNTRKLEVEEVFVSEGMSVKKGTPLFSLKSESVQEIRDELVKDVEEAFLTQQKLSTEQKETAQDALQIYEQNKVYGDAASLEYEEALHELRQKEEDALEKLETALEDVTEYQEDLAVLQEQYREAKHYLQEAEAAVSEEKDTYWRLKNEELREQAEKITDSNEDGIERLEKQIKEKELEIVSLQEAYHNAQKEYRLGEADAKAEYDKRIYNRNQAGEIYSIATDKIAYQASVAQEDYEDAEKKLQDFDAYIVDGMVSAQHEGVVTAVHIAVGDLIQKDTAIATLNDYEDVKVLAEVTDDDIKYVEVGDTVNLYFDAFPEGTFTGYVSHIGEATTTAVSDITYQVEITVSGDVEGLYQGMTGEVVLSESRVQSK